MKIGMVQMQSLAGDIDANISKHFHIIAAAADAGADALFFPELSLTGYEPSLAKRLATDQDDPRLDLFQSLAEAHQMTIGAGLPTKKGDFECISMVLFQPEKNRFTYSKKYLHADEEPFFMPGDNFPILTLGETQIGLAICYELSVPAHAEAALAHGAQLYIALVAKHARGMQAAGKRLSQIAKEYGIPT
ncbi:MAG: carbon-nitrogen hydrolase family protein, partial [Chloroflexota bacterium]